jgi:hypothetical protein
MPIDLPVQVQASYTATGGKQTTRHDRKYCLPLPLWAQELEIRLISLSLASHLSIPRLISDKGPLHPPRDHRRAASDVLINSVILDA